MTNSLGIINELRVDIASLKGKIIALSGNRLLSDKQKEAIEQVQQGLSFVVCQYICLVRKAYGEKDCWKLEDIDKPAELKNVSISPNVLLLEITGNAQDLNRKMLNLPGQNGCNDEQSKAIVNLIRGYSDWRIEHLNQLTKSFAG
jgi:hypothetical protein